MSDEGAPYPKKVGHWWVFVLVGVLGLILVHVGNTWGFEKGPKIFTKTLVDIGIGFIVASVVSAIFDVGFHRLVFGKPVQRLEERARELSKSVENNLVALIGTVSNLNLILKAADELKITSVYRRQTDEEMNRWKKEVEQALGEAEEFIYMAGKSLDELFPAKKDYGDQKIRGIINEKIVKGLEIRVVLANAYDPESPFRLECRERRMGGPSPNALWQPTKHTVEQLLRLKAETIHDAASGDDKKEKLRLRISTPAVPFAIVITESTVIVQHYLPYVNGRNGVVMHLSKAGEDTRNLYNIYKTSYEKFFDKAELCAPVFLRYVKRKSTVKPVIADILDYLNVKAL